MKKQYESVAYSAVQYAPALCLWREKGELEAVQYGIDADRIRVGYMGDAGMPCKTPRLHIIYATMSGRGYIRYNGVQYYLDEFMRVL